MEQRALLKQFNDECRAKFNPNFFVRDDNGIIRELKNVINSCQRNQSFIIEVLDYEVVERYAEINEILRRNEQSLIDKNKSKKKENQYDYINLKESDIKLLIVTYHIAAGPQISEEDSVYQYPSMKNFPKEESAKANAVYIALDTQNQYRWSGSAYLSISEVIKVYIAVPRIVDKFYFRINGNIFSAIYQVVDASTYNNSTSSASKRPTVTFKTMFMPVRITKRIIEIPDINKTPVKFVYFAAGIFNKTINPIKYILGKFGLAESLKFFGLRYIYVTDTVPENIGDDWYVFSNKNIFISVPKFIFDNEPIVQAFVYTLHKSATKVASSAMYYNNTFWLESLGSEFNNASIEKGMNVLDSLESIYDIATKNSLHLPEECKRDIYCILRWMMTNFNALKNKDNLDVSTKKIRYEEYIASLYAMKISQGIYRISDLGNKATCNSIKKALMTSPTYLLSAITRCTFVTYKNMVNDLDALTALKFTYKGISGIGEKANSVAQIYRNVDVSHMGRIDPDTSSNSDPGLTGSLCPLAETYDNSFSKFQEPNEWESTFIDMMDEFKKMKGLRQIQIARSNLLNESTDDVEVQNVNQTIAFVQQSIINPIKRLHQEMNSDLVPGYDLLGDGFFWASNEEWEE